MTYINGTFCFIICIHFEMTENYFTNVFFYHLKKRLPSLFCLLTLKVMGAILMEYNGIQTKSEQG